MNYDIDLYAKTDGLPPMGKLRDSKGRVVQQEFPHKKKKGKRKPESTADIDIEGEEERIDPSGEKPSGKIVDIII